MRFGKFDDELFEFNKNKNVKTKIHGSTNYLYPELELKTINTNKEIFILNEFSYNESILFKGKNIVEKIKKELPDINIYKLKDFPFIYTNQYDETLLPLDNNYLL